MAVGVCYPDTYAVEETFQLLKIPWEWYFSGESYEVVIAFRDDVQDFNGPVIDLTPYDFFRKIRDLLTNGRAHLHEPHCEILIDELRTQLKEYILLVEIPPVPWGHPYMVALTHDVDVTSVRECRFSTSGYAAYQCFRQKNIRAGIRLLLGGYGFGADPWALFDHWMTFERRMGVRSTFFFVPRKDDPGISAHPYRAVHYDVNHDKLKSLTKGGWEVGVHGIDNWTDVEQGKQERSAIWGNTGGNRTHWLMFDKKSWQVLDEAGYTYDTTFGYNDDAGFRAGTLQAYRPEFSSRLLELPLHIQDLGLFGKFCWAQSETGWERTPCLHLDEPGARRHCDRIFDYAMKYGGAVTILWHYENLTPPRNWSETYSYLIKRALADSAWVTTAGNVVEWFEGRRNVRITSTNENQNVTICTEGEFPAGPTHSLTMRIYVTDKRHVSINTEYIRTSEYIDIKLNKKIISVTFV